MGGGRNVRRRGSSPIPSHLSFSLLSFYSLKKRLLPDLTSITITPVSA